MAQLSKDMKFWLFGKGARWHAKVSFIMGCLVIVFVILGIVSAATNIALGLGASNWFLLAIIFVLWGLWAWLAAYFGAKED